MQHLETGGRRDPISLPNLPISCCPNSSNYYDYHQSTSSYFLALQASNEGPWGNRTSRMSVVRRRFISQFTRSETDGSHSDYLRPREVGNLVAVIPRSWMPQKRDQQCSASLRSEALYQRPSGTILCEKAEEPVM